MDHKRQVCALLHKAIYYSLCIAFNNIIYFYRGPHWVKAIMCLRQEGKLCRVPCKVIGIKYYKQ